MNSRQRVLAALNHQQPDRVPIDLGGTRQSGIAASTYVKLKERLALTTPTRVYDLYQVLAEVEEAVLQRGRGRRDGFEPAGRRLRHSQRELEALDAVRRHPGPRARRLRPRR